MKKNLIVLLAIFTLASGVIMTGCNRKPAPGPNPTGTAAPTATKTMSESIRTQVDKLLTEGKNLMSEKKYPEAIKIFDEILKLDDTNVKAMEGKANALMALKKWKEAQAVLNSLLSLEPDHVNGLLARARVNQELGNMGQFLSDRRRAARNSPFTFRSQYELGRALTESRKFNEALNILDKALKLTKDDQEKSDVYIAMAYAAYQKRDFKKAEGYCKKSLSLTEKPEHAYLLLMDIYAEQSMENKEMMGKAMNAYHKYRQADPQEKLIEQRGSKMRSEIYNNLGAIYRAKAELDKSAKYYKMALNIDPENKVLLVNHVTILAESGYPDEAKSQAEKWLKLNPKSPKNAEEFADQALIYLMLKQDKKALQYINTAVNREPNEALLYVNRALIFYYMGDKKSYERDYKKFKVRASKDQQEYVNKVLAILKTRVKPSEQ